MNTFDLWEKREQDAHDRVRNLRHSLRDADLTGEDRDDCEIALSEALDLLDEWSD